MTFIIFIAVLAVLVLSHEFGHFIFAKKSGMRVDEFGFGFPPRLFGIQRRTEQKLEKIAEKEENTEFITDTYDVQSGREIIQEASVQDIEEIDKIISVKKWRFIWPWGKGNIPEKGKSGIEGGNTIYSLNLIPLGGFVKIYGEEGEGTGDKRSFAAQSLGVRALILIAGVLFNLFLAWPVLTAGFLIGMPVSVEGSSIFGGSIIEKGVMILQVQENTPAQIAGFKTGDYLLRFTSDGDVLAVSDVKSVQDFIAKHAGKEIKIDYLRGKEKFTTNAAPLLKSEEGKGSLGIAMDRVGVIRLPFFRAIWEGLNTTVKLTAATAKALVGFFADLFTKKEVLSQVAGPVGIVGIVETAARSGFVFILQLLALLSINLALINIVPFPALDGGRLLFLGIELAKGRPISQKTANIANTIGFVILILLMLAITYQDILRLAK